MAKKQHSKMFTDSETRYIVTRDGVKVSEREYRNKEAAADEYGFWQRVIKNGRDINSKLDIIER